MATQHQQRSSTFGELLRQHRRSAGLSQEALAERADVSSRTVSDLERGVKTRPHPATMRALADALQLGADARSRLAAASRPVRDAPAASLLFETLPSSPSPLVGRVRELGMGTAALRAGPEQLLTVTGTGGVGKTRLALEIARGVAADYPDGVVFIDLGPVGDAALIIPTVATALGLRPAAGQAPLELLHAYLRDRRLLLVLDNCEHLLDGARSLITDLLSVSPGLRILATSRAPLRVEGERLLPLSPLPAPDRGMSVEALAQVPAVELFVHRARAIRPDFLLTESNAPDIAAICARLEGLPLAIELAVIQLRRLSPQVLAGALDQRLRLLSNGPEDAPERHRTLRAAIAWSYELLTGELQALFRALGVFAGGCTLESVAELAVAGDPFLALDRVEALADQGLMYQLDTSDGDIRFSMLQTVREYAIERLQAHAEEAQVRSRHARFLVALVERIGPLLHGPQPGLWLNRLEREQDNFRAALAWSLGPTGDAAIAFRLAAALWPFWHMRGHLHEGRTWLERTVAQGGRVDSAKRAEVFLKLANIANNLEDHQRAESLYQETLRLSEERGDAGGVASALVGLGMIAANRGDYADAEQSLRRGLALLEEAKGRAATLPGLAALSRLDVARGNYEAARAALAHARDRCRPDDVGVLAYLSLEQAQIERLQGHVDRAASLAEQCLVRFREMGERRAEAATLYELGQLALRSGHLQRGGNLFREAAGLHGEIRDEFGLVLCLEGCATVAVRTGQPEAAALLSGAADAWRTRIGTRRTVAEQQAFDQVSAALHAVMDESAVAARWAVGGQLEPGQALATALDDSAS